MDDQEEFYYRVTKLPTGCTALSVGDRFLVLVSLPPPQVTMLTYGPLAGIICELDSDQS